MDSKQINKIADTLDHAEQNQLEQIRFTKEVPNLTVSTGYQIQEVLVKKRLKRGEQISGYKMGLTSHAKMEQMGVKEPILGVLTDKMSIPPDGELDSSQRIHPKVEPEIAFVTSKELSGHPSPEEAFAACEYSCIALEIIDSRYLNFDFKLPDVVSDNCSAANYVLGPKINVSNHSDLASVKLSLLINETEVQNGVSAAILGNPIEALCKLVAMLNVQGKSLPAGSHVLAGAATAAVTVNKGDLVKLIASNDSQLSLRIGL